MKVKVSLVVNGRATKPAHDAVAVLPSPALGDVHIAIDGKLVIGSEPPTVKRPAELGDLRNSEWLGSRVNGSLYYYELPLARDVHAGAVDDVLADLMGLSVAVSMEGPRRMAAGP